MAATRVGVTVREKTKRVNTWRRPRNDGTPSTWVVQHHRGYVASVWIPGERKPIQCCDFHQKRSAAHDHGLRVGRAIAKERGLEPPIDTRRKARR